MIIDYFDTDKKILLVAEAGNNHEGNYALAEKLIRLARKAGADAVKFQVFRTELFISKKDSRRFAQLKSYELSFREFRRLRRIASSEGILFLATPFDLESARFLKEIVPAYKIASGDNNFYPLLEFVASTAKPLILSSGLVDLRTIAKVKSFIEGKWRDAGIMQELAVLHCVASYPVAPEEANLAAIPAIKKKLGCSVGYSDHTIGIDAAVLSVALGARIIEKHFTIDKNYSDFRDHRLSSDPKELAVLARKIREASLFLAAEGKVRQKSEALTVNLLRRSIAARRDLRKGARLSWNDITWLRPAGGMSPGKEPLVLGRILTRSVRAGELITPRLFIGDSF